MRDAPPAAPPKPNMNNHPTDHQPQNLQQWRSLRELDEQCGWSKGSAFRRFRAREAQALEDRDFVLLRHDRDAAAIAMLRASGRIYAGSVNVVLLSPQWAEALRAG